jgi:endoglucanase
MKQKLVLIFALFLTLTDLSNCQGFLKVKGKEIVNGKGEPVLLKGIGLGGWMLQEPYMLQLSKVARTQTEIKSKITELIGEKNCKINYTVLNALLGK